MWYLQGYALIVLLVVHQAACSTITVDQTAETSLLGCTLGRAVAALTVPDPQCPEIGPPPAVIVLDVASITLDGPSPTIVLSESVVIRPSGNFVFTMLIRTMPVPVFSIVPGAASVTLDSLHLQGTVGTATTFAGLINVDSSASVSLVLDDCVLADSNIGTLPGAGALVFASTTGQLTLSRCTVVNCVSTSATAGIATASPTTITSSEFRNLVGSAAASGQAGALLCENVLCNVELSSFMTCTGISGAIKAVPVLTSTINVESCAFQNCVGNGSGGAISAGNVNLLGDNDFIGNNALSGGAISASTVSMTTVNSVATFRSNAATLFDGGAISSMDVSFNCIGCELVFELNLAANAGGAIHCTATAEFIVASLTATSNDALNGSGGFLSAASSVDFDISDSASFLSNTCDGGGSIGGGAVFVSGPADFIGTATYDVFNNRAQVTTPPFGDGGFLHATGVSISPTQIDFRMNFATGDGGAVFDDSVLPATITNVGVVSGNTAFGAGGAFRVTGEVVIEVSGDVVDNQAFGSSGGVLVNVGSSGSTTFRAECDTSCELSRNHASNENGGVIFHENSDLLLIEISNYDIVGNSAGELGGVAVSFGALQLELVDTDVENNMSTGPEGLGFGGAFYVGLDCSAQCSGSFRGNSADSGGVFFIEGSAMIVVSGMEISGNSARLGSFYANTLSPPSALTFSSLAPLTISGQTASMFQSVGSASLNFCGGSVISGNEQLINCDLGASIAVTVDPSTTVEVTNNSFTGDSFMVSATGTIAVSGNFEFSSNSGDFLFNAAVVNVDTQMESIRDNFCGIASSTGVIEVFSTDIVRNSLGASALTSSPGTIEVMVSGGICSNTGTGAVFQAGTATSVSFTAGGGIESNSGTSLFGSFTSCTLQGLVLRNNADFGACSASSSVGSPFNGVVSPPSFEAGPGVGIPATVTFPATSSVPVVLVPSPGYSITSAALSEMTNDDGIAVFLVVLDGPNGLASITYTVLGTCEGEPPILAVQLINFIVPSASPSSSPTPTTTRSPSSTLSPTRSFTPAPSLSPSQSVSLTRSLSNSVQPIASSTASITLSSSSSRSAALQPSQAAPPAPSSSIPSPSSNVLPSSSRSRTRSAVPSASTSCANGCVAPTSAPVSSGGTTVVITDDNGESVGTVTVTEDRGDTVIVGPGDPRAEDALEEQRIRAGSPVVEIFLFDPNGNSIQPANDVEVCLKVEDESRAEEEGCLSFFDEESGTWICEDPCLDLDGDLACGDTDHLTNGGAGTKGGLCGDDDDSAFIFDEGWKDGILVLSVFAGICLICLIIAVVSLLFPSVTARVHGKEYSRIKDLRSRSTTNSPSSV